MPESKAAEAESRSLTSSLCRRYESVELYLHSPTRLHGVHSDNYTFITVFVVLLASEYLVFVHQRCVEFPRRLYVPFLQKHGSTSISVRNVENARAHTHARRAVVKSLGNRELKRKIQQIRSCVSKRETPV